MLIIISFLIIVDAQLYQYWGFRLDSTPLLYIKTPKEALASISVWIIVRQLVIGFLIGWMGWYIYRKYVNTTPNFEKAKWFFSPVMAFIVALLIIPIRGGFGIAPMNVGTAYFSKNNFLNHSAINVFWNVGFSLVESTSADKQYYFFDENKTNTLVKGYLNNNLKPDKQVIGLSKTNVIILILESFTANVIEPLGGRPGITPNINQLSKEGILFTNFYASGNRSDKGLVSILSGYPAQPNMSIIKYAGKTRSLPRLPLTLKKAGYTSAFYYGGDINFANMRSYLMDSHFDDIVSMDDFPKSTYNSKWGAQDHVVFQRLFADINCSKAPFFKTYFTLSSHEPFEVPCKFMTGTDEPSKFMNSIHYTDSCVGDFIAKAKRQPWWKNTLIILVADHGHQLPDNLPNHIFKRFHIPMLWLGGALTQTGVNDKFATQIDIASTVLHQIGLSSKQYEFSKDIYSSHTPSFAFYSYQNGFGLLRDSIGVVYDCDFKKILETKGSPTAQTVDAGKAYLQHLYRDIDKR
ncbi:MAG: LTA synthase family protein [Bacteroidota bacterium]|nr:LTA synthase family protein [Bacteroidota bacterium]